MKNRLFTILTMVTMMATVLVGCQAQTAGIVTSATAETNVEESTAPVTEESSTDLEAAKQIATNFFAENFSGCVMTTFQYDDSYSAEECAKIAQSYGADEAVVFTSSFYVPDDCEIMTLNPGMTYEDYTYTLTRSAGEDWMLQTCGMQ